MSSFLPNFLWSQLFVTPPIPTATFQGKTVIVTGGNTGLGLEAARWFVKLRAATVILAVRSLEKGEAAKRNIEQDTSCPQDTIQVWRLDMASYASVKQFAARVKNELPRVDVVTENAGIQPHEFEMLEDSESTITVNVISTFLLAILLLPALRTSAVRHSTRANLSIVGSDTHLMAVFPERNSKPGEIFTAMNNRETALMGVERYMTSKLIQVFCIRALAANMKPDSPVIVNNVTPGLAYSNMAGDGWIRWTLMKVFGRTTEVGSRPLVLGAAAGRESHGQYMHDGKVKAPAHMVVGEGGAALQQAVWEELCAKLESIEPGVTGNI